MDQEQQGRGGAPWISIGALFAGLAVGAGALGAHALEARLDADQLANWETAVRYQLAHGLALILYGLWLAQDRTRVHCLEGWLFTLGTACFSGSIDLLVFDLGSSWVWPLTPLGGSLLLAGWILWAVRAWRAG